MSIYKFFFGKPKTETKPPIVEQEFNEKHSHESSEPIEHLLRDLKLNSTDSPDSSLLESLSSWEEQLLADPKNRLAQAALAHTSIKDTIASFNLASDRYLFNTEVDIVGSPAHLNNQKLSGRCWIFATSNVLRSKIIKRYNLRDDGFQLSQAYFFFYDKLEKANFFLDNVIETAHEDLDSRLVQYLLGGPVGDGGQWDMIVNVVNKYGIVPNELFPDNFQATATSNLNFYLTEKLREFALVLRELVAKNTPDHTIAQVKSAMNKQVYNIIALLLGTPPKPTDSFVWEFVDKDGQYRRFETTPREFAQKHAGTDVNEYFSLINDPRNAYNTLYTVDYLNNVLEGKPIEYVNLEVSALKKAAIRMLQANEPVFFGCDVGKDSDSKLGIMDTKGFDLALSFGTSVHLSKAERLRFGSSQMTHAMVLTGVHLDPNGAPVRWKVENSWGPDVGDKGYFLMSDAWFDEYVFQIVTQKKYVGKSVYEIWKGKKYEVLPFYDPMGLLA